MTNAATEQGISSTSQWERIGGAPAVAAVLDRFYEEVLADSQLAGFFAGVAVDDIKPHLAEVLKVVLGGPDAKTDIDLAGYLTGAHSGLGVAEADYARTGELLLGVLAEFELPEDVVKTVTAALESVAPFVISTR
jgi:hemoglobin